MLSQTVKFSLIKGAKTIYLNEHTQIDKSLRKFVIHESHINFNIEMRELCFHLNNTSISVTVKIIEISPSETVTTKTGKSFIKQDCIVADSTARGQLVLRENDVYTLTVNHSYKLAPENTITYL